jgi:hypothetical protein
VSQIELPLEPIETSIPSTAVISVPKHLGNREFYLAGKQELGLDEKGLLKRAFCDKGGQRFGENWGNCL